MRHYEVVILIHPDKSEQVPVIMERYADIITKGNGVIHRQEDWGRRQLSYAINDLHKAHYILMNIECDQLVLDELKNTFKYNELILRYLFIKKKSAITTESILLKKDKDSRTI